MRSSVRAATLLVSIVGVLAGCGVSTSAESAPETVVVGSGSTDVSRLLAQIYAGGLRSAGATVEVDEQYLDRASYLAALDRGDVAMVPDLTGELLRTFDSQSMSTEAEDVFTDLNRSLPAGLSVGDYAIAEDRLAIAVASDREMGDGETVTGFLSREEVTVGIVDGHVDPMDVRALGARSSDFTGASFTDVTPYSDARAAVDGLNAGEVEALAIRTASFGPLAKDLTTLPDDDSVYPAQNVVPLYRDATFGEEEIRSFAVVAGELTTADLADMIGEVRGGMSASEVAARWLDERSL